MQDISAINLIVVARVTQGIIKTNAKKLPRATLVKKASTIHRPAVHLVKHVRQALTTVMLVGNSALSAPLVPTTLQSPANRFQIVFPAPLVRAALSLAAHP